MGAGADRQIIAETPVIQVVPAASPGPRERRHFVAFEPLRGQQTQALLFQVGAAVTVGLLRRRAEEGGIRFDGQLVPAQVRRLQRHRLAQVIQRLRRRLARQGVHQVQIEIVEAGVAGVGGGAQGFLRPMDAAQRLQMPRIETLHSDRQPVDARRTEAGEAAGFQGAGVGFQSNLDVVAEAQPAPQPLEQGGVEVRAHQAGRAAADKDRLQGAAMHPVQVLVQVGEQGVQVGALRQLRLALMGVEVAVGAFAHAPGHVHIERQRRGGEHGITQGVLAGRPSRPSTHGRGG